MRRPGEQASPAAPTPAGSGGPVHDGVCGAVRAHEGEAVVRVRDLTFSYKRHPVLLGVSFDVFPGDFVAVIGANGSGKSTLCRVLRGIVPAPAPSRVEVGGSPAGSPEALRMTAYTAGNDHVPRFLTAREYLRFLARLHSDPANRVRVCDKELGDMFASLGMRGRQADLMTSYSHGMLKKTQLAAALLVSRRVTVVDETMNGIDIEAQYRIESALRDYRSAGGAVIMCSHDFSMLQRCANRVLMLDDGYLVEDARVDSLERSGTTIEALVTSYLGVGGG